jgi:Na+-transporting methylmalonyl-CoA/oxaloacetate decarboxylase gamma subunit
MTAKLSDEFSKEASYNLENSIRTTFGNESLTIVFIVLTTLAILTRFLCAIDRAATTPYIIARTANPQQWQQHL